MISGKSVGFLFLFFKFRFCISCFNKCHSFVMQEDMSQFMKKAEPEDIRPTSPNTHQEHRLLGRNPERRASPSRIGHAVG